LDATSSIDGTAAKPVVIKSAGDGEVTFDGGGNAVLFDLTAAAYQYVEGITVRNTDRVSTRAQTHSWRRRIHTERIGNIRAGRRP
jgi:hypothetical protein